MKLRARQWLILACALGGTLQACGGGNTPDGGTDVTSQPDMNIGTDAQPDRAMGNDVQGNDVQGNDVQGMDVQGTDVQGNDVQGNDVQGMDVQGTDVQGTDASTDVVGTDVVGTDVVGTDVRSDVVGTDVVGDVPAAGACLTPIRALTLPTDTAMGTLPTGPDTISSTSCQGDTQGAEHVYTLHVATRTGVNLSTTTSVDTVLSVRRACADSATEVACNDDDPNSTTNSSALRTVLDPGDYAVIVDEFDTAAPGTGGAYTLNLSSFAVAANASCSGATAVMNGTMLTAQNLNSGGTSLDGVCLSGALGPTLFYRATIPATTALTFTATPTGTPAWDAVIRVLDTCAATTCAQSTDAAGSGTAENITVTNSTGTPRDVIIAVSSYDDATFGTFDVAVTTRALAANAACSGAVTLVPGTPLTAQNLAGGGPSLAGTCLSSTTGPTLYYSLTIPPGQGAQVTATPTGATAWNPGVRILDMCGATACLISNDNAGTGMPEPTALNNPGTTPRTVIVAVSSFSATTLGTFDLAATLAPIPFVETTTTGACDDMSTGTVLAGPTTDDSASTVQALPFAFNLVGTAVTNYSVTSNGFAQLYAATGMTPSTSFGNTILPQPNTPNGLVAPFWDDLRPAAASGTTPASEVRTLVTGTMPLRHFTIQWTNWTFSPSLADGAARVTFQAKLFETTNVIEFHYCSLTTTSTTLQYHTGQSATVGIENGTGLRGIQHSFNTAMSVNASTALRFTPVP